MGSPILVGLDIGGAKTAGALCDGAGRVLAKARDEGAAIVGPPDEHFFDVVRRVIGRLCAEARVAPAQVERVAIGLSGVDYADERQEQHRLIEAGLGLEGRLELVNDGLVALWGATGAERAALLQHGTGITAAYRPAHGEEAIFDSLDVAEVYDLRRRAFALTARMIDGRAAPTPLKDRVLAHCRVEAQDFAEWAFRRPEAGARRATVGAIVFEAWRGGDPSAEAMVREAAADYVLAMQAMGRRMDGSFQAVFAGGVIAGGGGAFQRLIGELLAKAVPVAQLTSAVLPPELGAVVLAAHGHGLDHRRLFDRLASQELVP